MSTTTHTMTAEEFAEYAGRHGRCELVRGEVRHMSPSGAEHGEITSRLHYFIARHVYENDLGKVFAAETGFHLDDRGKPTVRAPDIAFIQEQRADAADTPKFAAVAPDLAVETLSPSDTASDLGDKVRWWLSSGARLVWVVDPPNQAVTVHRPGGAGQLLERHQTLEGEDVLPGFSLRLSELFVQPTHRHGDDDHGSHR